MPLISCVPTVAQSSRLLRRRGNVVALDLYGVKEVEHVTVDGVGVLAEITIVLVVEEQVGAVVGNRRPAGKSEQLGQLHPKPRHDAVASECAW